MLIAVCVLAVVALIEAYVIVEKESRIIYLRKRLLRQIRMNDSMKMKLQNQKVWVVEKPDIEKAEKVINDFKASPVYPMFANTMLGTKMAMFETKTGMPIEMTEVLNEKET